MNPNSSHGGVLNRNACVVLDLIPGVTAGPDSSANKGKKMRINSKKGKESDSENFIHTKNQHNYHHLQ